MISSSKETMIPPIRGNETIEMSDYENVTSSSSRFAEIYNNSLTLKFKIWWWNLTRRQRRFYINSMLIFVILFAIVIVIISMQHTPNNPYQTSTTTYTKTATTSMTTPTTTITIPSITISSSMTAKLTIPTTSMTSMTMIHSQLSFLRENSSTILKTFSPVSPLNSLIGVKFSKSGDNSKMHDWLSPTKKQKR
uniref:Uncharacterized protein n=1 Tax=Loa loa TaxID=7209 RepID=A0A1I7W3R9_LOALO